VFIRTIAVSFLLLSPVSFSASFDCKKASTAVEKLICKDNTISYYDDLLGQTYKSRVVTSFSKALSELKSEQRQWLKKRNSCTSTDCILSEYKKRITELKNASHLCDSFKQNFIYARTNAIPFEKKGKVNDFFKVIGQDNIPIKIQNNIKDEDNYSYLYRVRMNDDEIDDFVIVSSGGRADCQSYYFLASTENGYNLAPGVNYNRYSNEGKLCSSWGQDMYFIKDRFKKNVTYSVIRDIKNNNESYTLSLAPISESSKTAEMCKVKINISTE
jgi:uncharacterized protein